LKAAYVSSGIALKADVVDAAALRVLMVEDDPNDAELLKAHLAAIRPGGAQVLHARSLAEGLMLLQSQDVQITLLDLDLPDSQGLHTLERVRAAASGPVIVVSGNGHPSLVDEALKRRAYDVIPKDQLDAATLQRVLRLATLHREAGGERGASEGRYRALLESSSEALVLLDAKGRIQYASAAMRRVLGYNSAEILGRTGLSFVRPEDRVGVQKAFAGLSAEPGAFVTLRVGFQHRDGGLRVLESSLANRLGDAEVAAIVCSYRDVTQEEEHRERFAATFENSPLGLAHVDLEGRFQIVNLRLCTMLGYAAEELIGREVRELSHAEDIDAAAALHRQLRAGIIPQFTTRKRYLRKDGATLWVQLTVALERDAQGQPKYDVAAFEDVSESVRAQERLRASEQRFRSLVALSSDFYWETDAEHRISVRDEGGRPSAAPTFAGGAAIGKRRWELPFLSPDMQGWMAHKALLDAHLPFQDFELSRPAVDGGARHFSISGEPMFDAQGAFKGYRGVGCDITVRKSALLTLELEHAVNRHLADAHSALGGVQAVIRAICELHNWDHGRFWQVDDEAGVMRFAALWSKQGTGAEVLAPALLDVVFQPGQGIAGRVWQSGEPLWVADASNDPRTAKHALWRTPLRGTFMFPVKAAGRTLGVLTFASSEIRRPDERLLVAAVDIGNQIGQFLQRKRNEEDLRRFRAGMEASGDMILLIDHKAMRYVDVNETVCRTLGYTREEMLAMGPQDVLPASRDELQRAYERFVADPGAIHGMNSVYRCKDGSSIPFESSRRVLQLENGAVIVAISRDIRPRLQSEQALRESEARFRSLTELSADWYWEQDAELRFVSTAGHDQARGGISAAQHDGLRRWELPGTEPLEGTWDAHKALLEARQPFRDFMLRRAGNDGKVHYVDVAGEPIVGDNGTFRGYRGVAKDVTQKMEAVLALRESEERFRSLTALSSDWYWEQDAEFRFTRASADQTSNVFGDPANVLGKTRWELPLTPLNSTWGQHKESLQARRTYRDFEYSYVDAGGSLRYISASGYPVFDADRLFAGYRGVAKDITARKLAESELRRFRAALDISADAISLVDAESMRIIDINDAALRNLGYERHELVGQPVSIVFPDRSPEDIRAAYDRLNRSDHGAELLQMRHRRKDGSVLPVEVTRRVLRTDEGTYIIGIARDLTERVRSEAQLRASHERFEMVSRATNDVVWDWDLVTNQIWWNENFQKLFGYEPQETGADAESWTSRIHPEDAPRIKSQVDTAIRCGAKAWAGEYRFLCRDGTYLDVFDRGLLMHDERGRPVRMIGAMMDVSERKHAERHMRVHAERQAAVARFGQFALGRRQIEELYAEAARALRCEGVDAACVLEMFTAQGEFLVRAAQGEGPHAMLGLRVPIAPDSVWPEILRENTPRIAGKKYLSSRPLDRPWHAWVQTMGSAMYVPVHDDEKPIAMLCVYALAERAFSTEDLRFAEAVGHVLSTALQRQKAEQRLAHMAQFDSLTGLPNRTLLQDRLAQTIVQSRRKRWHAGALFVDLDRFKLVNDTLGHHLGDALIRQVGERLLDCVRPGDTVGRISGDEFAVVLADMARPDDAALVAQKILDALARPFDLGGNEAYISASIGIAAFPGDGEDAETLLKNADIAMYRAKESARNCYRFFTAEMNQRTVAKVQLNTDLRRAIERGEFTLHYQPKVDLADGGLRGMEALLRWNHPERGMVAPGEFIPALEDSGLILPVGEWVIGEACAQLRRWKSEGRAVVPVAVNLSPKQFRRGDLDRVIGELLARQDLEAGMLELEITESCLMEDPEAAVRVMHNLRAAGLRISIDDFGTGYSSLSYLTRLPLSALKIDRSFVRDAGASAEAASIVRAVIDMAQNMRFTVIAEGVETEQQVAFLRQHGCDQAQGYFFGRPNRAEVAGEALPRA
jgi:diguanylate cyclase (GGDEF)-like protein/PAS domain S-box-containing protein